MVVEFLRDWKAFKKGTRMTLEPGDLIKRGIVKQVPVDTPTSKMQSRPRKNKMQIMSINK